MNHSEREISEAWDRFIVSFFEDCTGAQATWKKFRNTYYASFRDYIDCLIKEIDSSVKR
jgi:hypothetical protein